MKISASYWMFEDGLEAKLPITKAIQQAKDLGFDGIELCVASEGVLTHNTTEEECKDIVAKAKDIGLEIASVASLENWACSPTSNSPEVRKKIIDFTKKALQVAKWPGTAVEQWHPRLPFQALTARVFRFRHDIPAPGRLHGEVVAAARHPANRVLRCPWVRITCDRR